jgi:hypothetical protein
MPARPNPRNDTSYYSYINSTEGPSNGRSSTGITQATASGQGGGDKHVINQFRKKSLDPKVLPNSFNSGDNVQNENRNQEDTSQMKMIQMQKQMNQVAKNSHTPKLIVYGVKDTA